MTEYEMKEQICEVGHLIWQLGFVAANDGNISMKIDDNTFLTTPTGTSKRILTPEMIIKMNANNEIVECPEGYRPSSEFKMHLRCYKERPDIGAVVHAHPPTATGFAIAHIPLDDYTMPEAIIFLGSVPIAPYATPGSQGVPDGVAPFLAEHDTILLMNHGALTVGKDITQAYYRMETLEHFAKVSLVARQLGGAKELSRENIDECCEIAKSFPIRHPGYKKYSL
ncbi:MAG: class II aldolase/adducin family protein [Ruminiclostridium sp.]